MSNRDEEAASSDAAEFVLEREATNGDGLARHADAAERLATAVENALAEASRAIELPVDECTAAGLGERDGMFALDAQFVAFLFQTASVESRPIVDQVRKAFVSIWPEDKAGRRTPAETNKRSIAWVANPQTVMARPLAAVLWRSKVRPQLAREHEKPAALSIFVAERLASVMSPGVSADTLGLKDRFGARILGLEIETPPSVPLVEAGTAEGFLQYGLRLCGTSLNAYRLLLWEVTTANQQVLAEIHDPRTIRVGGGWEGLTLAIGAGDGGDSRREVQALFLAQAHLRWAWPDGSYGNLINYRHRPSTVGRVAELSISLGDALMPHFSGTRFPSNSLSDREARRLVPIVKLPPFVGRERDWSVQAAFHFRLVIEFRRRAKELVEFGGIELTEAVLEGLSRAAGCPRRIVPKLLERWTQDGDDGPAFLSVVERNRYSLGPSHKSALQFLIDGGTRAIKGRNAGRRSRDRKRRKLGLK